MSKKKSNPLLKKKLILLSLAFITIPIIFISFLTAWLFVSARIYPNISVAGVDVGLLTREQAFQKVAKTISERGAQSLEFELNDTEFPEKQSYVIELNKQEAAPYVQKAITEASELGRKKSYFPQAKIEIRFDISLPIKKQVEYIAQAVNQPPIDSTLRVYEGEIAVTPSQSGTI